MANISGPTAKSLGCHFAPSRNRPQIARDDFEDRRERQRQGIDLAKCAGRYAGRKPNTKMHERVIALKSGGCSIAETARLAGVSVSQVKRVWAQNQAKVKI
ncbi:Resolvase [Pseudomonas amygdali pv. mori]|uniref:Resolvase n=1 Tax=Pseudomonas amygdali pv. mori TaxID=34065 RepID=A0A3M5J4N1_PSEA0|nr:Resolvase [Pseudomonas amygdali pv. mori]